MDLDHALAAHAEWKVKLRSAMTSQSQLDARTIKADNCCPLGKWLHGEAKAKYGGLASFQGCIAAHADFHSEAGKVADLINKKMFKDAEIALGASSPYAAASSKAGTAIVRLKKEAAL